MKWYLLVASIFSILVSFFKNDIEKHNWLKVTKAYVSVMIFSLYGFILSHEYLALDIIIIALMIFTVVRNSNAFIKSYKLSEFKGNLHIAIVNLLQIIIAYAVIYKFLYVYVPNSFNVDYTSLNPFEIYLNFIYFSTITFATLGYGDIVPISLIAKCVVVTEVILFLLIVTVSISFISKRNINKEKAKGDRRDFDKINHKKRRHKIYRSNSGMSQKRMPRKKTILLKYYNITFSQTPFPHKQKRRNSVILRRPPAPH